jgi:putative pyruvate formate lyase activating enzyme
MRCVYCQNHEISRKTNGKRYSPQELSTALRGLEALGVHNINFVTPTHYARRIADTLDIYRPALPVIFNTSGYERAETVQYLQKYADVWLPDFKYGDDNLALLLSGRKCYTVAARTSVAEMLKKPQKYKDGLIQSGVILRHLVLPGFLENSKSVLDIIKEDFGTDVTLSIMAQYTPVCITDKPSLHRALKPLEYKIILNYALALGFRDIFTQEILSSDERYIPDFDNT